MASNPILKLVLLLAIMSDLCIECGMSVSGCKHAVTCDACERWQHRLCNTGEINCYLNDLMFLFQTLS